LVVDTGLESGHIEVAGVARKIDEFLLDIVWLDFLLVLKESVVYGPEGVVTL
jgi:hypothetical protein